MSSLAWEHRGSGDVRQLPLAGAARAAVEPFLIDRELELGALAAAVGRLDSGRAAAGRARARCRRDDDARPQRPVAVRTPRRAPPARARRRRRPVGGSSLGGGAPLPRAAARRVARAARVAARGGGAGPQRLTWLRELGRGSVGDGVASAAAHCPRRGERDPPAGPGHTDPRLLRAPSGRGGQPVAARRARPAARRNRADRGRTLAGGGELRHRRWAERRARPDGGAGAPRGRAVAAALAVLGDDPPRARSRLSPGSRSTTRLRARRAARRRAAVGRGRALRPRADRGCDRRRSRAKRARTPASRGRAGAHRRRAIRRGRREPICCGAVPTAIRRRARLLLERRRSPRNAVRPILPRPLSRPCARRACADRRSPGDPHAPRDRRVRRRPTGRTPATARAFREADDQATRIEVLTRLAALGGVEAGDGSAVRVLERSAAWTPVARSAAVRSKRRRSTCC